MGKELKGNTFCVYIGNVLRQITFQRRLDRCPLNLIETPRALRNGFLEARIKANYKSLSFSESKHLNQNSLKGRKKSSNDVAALVWQGIYNLFRK